MGGYVATCYVDWLTLPSPQEYIADLLTQYRALAPEQVLQFSDSMVTDNEMPYRDLMEDASKIYYLTQQLENEGLIFVPQIIHEPWHDRYRIHPGSGRALAIWLAGYERFRTIYTHFNEPEFSPPGIALRISSPQDLIRNAMHEPVLDQDFFDFETYYAFPTDPVDIEKTVYKDSVWNYDRVQTMMPWEFIRFSEGHSFLTHKGEWRFESWQLWLELQEPICQIGDTEFYFNDSGKITKIIRKGVVL